MTLNGRADLANTKTGYLLHFQQKFILELAVNKVMTSFLEECNGIKKTRF